MKEKKVEYFTDAMHKEMFPFQPPMTQRSSSGKPVMKPITIKPHKK